MDEPSYKQIINFESVFEHFGYWPDFHDSEVLEFCFNRSSANGDVGYQVSFDVHVFEMTNEISIENTYVLKKHCVISFEFYNVEILNFNGFNHQNALYGISFIKKSNMDNKEVLEVNLEGAHGLETSFRAKQALVSSLKIGKPND